jgi:hypothetical protein
MPKNRKTTWTTYATYAYTHDVANDQCSAGGIHDHQIRCTRTGKWQKRIRQLNGRNVAYGQTITLDAHEGEAAWNQASERN